MSDDEGAGERHHRPSPVRTKKPAGISRRRVGGTYVAASASTTIFQELIRAINNKSRREAKR